MLKYESNYKFKIYSMSGNQVERNTLPGFHKIFSMQKISPNRICKLHYNCGVTNTFIFQKHLHQY